MPRRAPLGAGGFLFRLFRVFFFECFFGVVSRGRLGGTWLHFGAFLEVFWSLFGTFLEVWQNSVNCIPSAAKTMFLRFGEGPESLFF